MVKKKTEGLTNKTKRKSKKIWRIPAILIICAIVGGALRYSKYWPASQSNISDVDLYTVKSGDLNISVIENGSIKPLKSVNIKAPTLNEYYTNIVSIVPEGTIITPEDVNNMVLVELDSSTMVEMLPQLQIDVDSAELSYKEAQEQYDIRLKQNESDITAAELKVKFAKMDIQKYLGMEAAEEVIADVSLDTTTEINMDVLIQKIEDSNSLCEASQKMLDSTSSINMAEEELERTKYEYEGVQQLFDNNYASENELKEAELRVTRQEIEKEKTEISLALFKNFEFPKQVEQLVSDYLEATLALDRTESSARSELAQADARRKGAESSLKTRQERLKTIQEQIESCSIKAPSPGQVVYYSSMQSYYVQYPIEVGAQIPRNYTIIVLPDTSQLLVEIKINETWINKIQVGQKAKITTTAFPDKVLTGEVLKKAPMADSQTSSLLAGVKVYTTEVSIEGTHDYIKTGMTAKVEITIDELDDVLYIPIQSVVSEGASENKVCFVMTNKGPERRPIEIGLFNDDFVEVKDGLNEGDKVLFNPPRWDAQEEEEEQTEVSDDQAEEIEDTNNVEETKPSEPVMSEEGMAQIKALLGEEAGKIINEIQ